MCVSNIIATLPKSLPSGFLSCEISIQKSLPITVQKAGLSEEAIRYWQQAGQHAVERSANEEAITHFTRALTLVETLPETPQRGQQELAVRIALGAPLLMARGYQAAEVVQTYARAWELCRQIGESPQLVPVLAGLFRYYFGCGELSTAYDLGRQMLRLAQQGSDPFPLLAAHLMLGSVFGVRGEFLAARDHFERGIALSDAQADHAAVFLYGDDPGTLCLTQAGTVLWYLGYPDQALQKSRQALARAQTLEIPYVLANAWGFASQLHGYRREGEAALEYADSLLALSVKHGFQYWALEGQFLRKVALLLQHQKNEEQFIRDNLPEHEVSASVPGRVRLMGMIAEAYGKVGKAKEGLRIVDEELALMQRDGTCMYEAELHRIKGELLLQMSAKE